MSESREFARHLRNNATPAEHALWSTLSRLRPRFTRQLRVEPHVGDFACRRARLLVEADGSQHVGSTADIRRTAHLEKKGWRVIRFWNAEILSNLDGVVELIIAEADARLPEGEAMTFVESRAGRERRPRSRGKKDHP